MIIVGRVFSGLGQGAFFTQLDWIKEQCQEALGFVPFPGTLNLKVKGEYLDALRKLREEKGISLVPPTAEFCPAECFWVYIGTIRAAVIIPHAEQFTSEVHLPDVIEVIAPVNIKETLSVEDGNEVTLEYILK